MAVAVRLLIIITFCSGGGGVSIGKGHAPKPDHPFLPKVHTLLWSWWWKLPVSCVDLWRSHNHSSGATWAPRSSTCAFSNQSWRWSTKSIYLLKKRFANWWMEVYESILWDQCLDRLSWEWWMICWLPKWIYSLSFCVYLYQQQSLMTLQDSLLSRCNPCRKKHITTCNWCRWGINSWKFSDGTQEKNPKKLSSEKGKQLSFSDYMLKFVKSCWYKSFWPAVYTLGVKPSLWRENCPKSAAAVL